MKKLILILGANGVGKSTTAKKLLELCLNCAYVDADWCRAINPFFPLTKEMKSTVTENIYCLLKNYLLCERIDVVVFPYAFHGERKEIFEAVRMKLKDDEIRYELCPVILKCSLEENYRRARLDNRDEERICRGIQNTFHFYDAYDYPVIDTLNLTPYQVAKRVMELAEI